MCPSFEPTISLLPPPIRLLYPSYSLYTYTPLLYTYYTSQYALLQAAAVAAEVAGQEEMAETLAAIRLELEKETDLGTQKKDIGLIQTAITKAKEQGINKEQPLNDALIYL